jgi:bifunctional enzyme CysN/CysC
MLITKKLRAKKLKQKPCVIWFTGLSGAGKSTTANALEHYLYSHDYKTYSLDADKVRQGLCSGLGYSEQDRSENVRRLGEAAKLLVDSGLIVLVASISPFAADRKKVRAMFEVGEFIEVYIKTPFMECERRDIKGLYKKVRNGDIKHFTGIDSPYQTPTSPEIEINTLGRTIEETLQTLILQLKGYGVINNTMATQQKSYMLQQTN